MSPSPVKLTIPAAALLAAAEEAYTATLASYRQGLVTYPELASARTNRTQARTTVQETRAQLFTAVAALAFSTGDLARPEVSPPAAAPPDTAIPGGAKP